MPQLEPNATLVERIQFYVETMQIDKGKALAQLGDYLEECFLWDVSFEDGAF
jgi:hypothetical protein